MIKEAFGYVIRFCYNTIGFKSYALALFWFALIVKLLLLPLSIYQQKGQIKLALLRPKMYAIEKKYAGRTDQVTMQKKRNELLELQQREGYSPYSGCLPMIIQLVLVIILYNIIQNPLTYISRVPAETITALMTELALEAKVGQIGLIGAILEKGGVGAFASLAGYTLPDLSLFGVIDLSANPAFWSWSLLIPPIVFASQYFSMKLTRRMNPTMNAANQNADPATRMSTGMMDIVMPLMTLFLAFSLPSALGLYWLFQGVLGMAQMVILAKVMPLPTFTEEELKAAERELRGKGTRHRVIGSGSGENARTYEVAEEDDTPVRPRSLHYIDEDDEDAAPIRPQNRQNQRSGSTAPKKRNITGAPLKKDDRKDNND